MRRRDATNEWNFRIPSRPIVRHGITYKKRLPRRHIMACKDGLNNLFLSARRAEDPMKVEAHAPSCHNPLKLIFPGALDGWTSGD